MHPDVAANQPSPNRIRALVVDDEPLARSTLTVLLRRDPEIEIIGECGSGAEALVLIRSTKPDLLFLDVEMPECDGFDVLEILGGELTATIVFVTAYDKYALRAFETGALDYLLKPFDDARFHRALQRAKQRVAQARIEHVRIDPAQIAPPTREWISLKSAGQVLFLKISEIDWIEAADYYSCLHVGTRSHLLRRSMSELEQELDSTVFCRIHRSTIANLDRVRCLKLNESGEYDVCLDNGATLRLSRGYRRQLQSRLAARSRSAAHSAEHPAP
jgi:two-component system LytT family response regulator